VTHEGQQLVLVRDSLGLIPDGRALAPEFFQLLALYDGSRTVEDVQAMIRTQAAGQDVDDDLALRILNDLDAAYLMDSRRYRAARERVAQDFQACPTRACALGGRSYPNDADALRDWLDNILAEGKPQGAASLGRLKALVAPHIDPPVGAAGYAAAYGLLQATEAPQPRLVLALGVGHGLADGLFSLTVKDFETPLGMVSNAAELVRELLAAGERCALPRVCASNDFAHRSEHSIEFQTLFLKHLLANEECVLLPILCGSLLHGLPEYSRQAFREATGPFLDALAAIVAQEDVLLVAGVDFSHIGPKFGHRETASALEPLASAHDAALLGHLVRQDADAFWAESSAVRDGYNVCGFSALATLLEILPPCAGQSLHYQLWHERPTRSAVSFAAAAFRMI
jgi:AmmeMemoRadiSam system protein B